MTGRRASLARALWVCLVIAVAAAAALAPDIAGSGTPKSKPPSGSSNPHGKFRDDCRLCHRADAWSPARIDRAFDHEKRSGFALRGAHAAARCQSCHASLDFSGGPGAQCASCHEDPHRGELGGDCARCHTSRSFIERTGMVRAHAFTQFPLTGAHAALDCEMCHEMAPQGHARFVGTDAACQSCHAIDYRATRDPPHLAAGFPLECQICHTPMTWRSARFDHSGTAFPLTGAHRGVACAGCHGDGVYRGKSAACASCHRGDYDRTSDPPHAGAGFPLTCESCHNTTTWSGARFDHDTSNFPIYSGRHAGLWSSCTTCHNVPQNYSAFTCFSCHPHNDRAKTDGDHSGRAGYVYDSAACYSCHPRGTH